MELAIAYRANAMQNLTANLIRVIIATNNI